MKTREIIGKWELIDGKVIADSNCKTIESMIKNDLIKLESSEDGWTSRYQGNDGRIWELSYPESHLQGGGPPKLIQINSGVRRIVNLTKPKDGINRLMIFNDDYGTYLFGYKKTEDCGAEWDEWYETENGRSLSRMNKKTLYNTVYNSLLVLAYLRKSSRIFYSVCIC